MATYELPFSAEAQTFRISMGGTVYQLTMRWNDSGECWALDVADSSGAQMLSNIPIITGVDLLGPYGYMGFGGGLFAMTDNDPLAVPTYDNIGDTAHVYFVTV